MKNRMLRVYYSVIVFLAFMIVATITTSIEVQAASFQSSNLSQANFAPVKPKEVNSCQALLLEAASQAGFEGEMNALEDFDDGSEDTQACLLSYKKEFEPGSYRFYYLHLNETNPTPEEFCKFDPSPVWTDTVLNGYHAQTLFNQRVAETHGESFPTFTSEENNIHWCMHAGQRNYYFIMMVSVYNVELLGPAPDVKPMAEQVIRVAEKYLPLTDAMVDIPESEIMTEASIETEQPIEETEEQSQVVVVPYGSETETPSDNNQEVLVVPYGESDAGETATSEGSFSETWQSEQAKTIRSPYLPILGGLIGGGAAWLFAQGASKTSSYVSGMTAAPVIAQPPVSVPELIQTPPKLVTEPPELVTEPPRLETTPPSKANVLTPGQAGYNILKEAVNATGNVSGVYKKYLAGKDSAETLKAVREAIQQWHLSPNAATSANYLEKLKNLNIFNENKLADRLGYLSKGIDALEASQEAAKICEERGYTGWEAAGTTYAKVAEKAIVWYITKNPVAGLADAAVGGVTQMVRGKKGKIDLGVVVDKAHDTIDKLSKSAAEKYYFNQIEAKALEQKNENVQNMVERIRKQVEEGKITKNQGAYRLERVLEIVNKETPKL